MATAQDADFDGISDQLEEELARRFAPEWRFHKEAPGDRSKQNKTEQFYPSSVEWWYNQVVKLTGKLPLLVYNGNSTLVQSLLRLDSMLVSGTTLSTSDTAWGRCNNKTIRIEYPKKIPGDPEGFPTYYRCYPLGNGWAGICYLLFHPYDYKGSYCGLSFGNHRGDWEGINVLVSGISDYSDSSAADNAFIEQVKYSGHGPKKYISSNSPHFSSVLGTHSKVYLSFGSHTPYPEPGEWHNYIVSGIVPNWYDDFFHGNGLVVQSWVPERKLINMGETVQTLVGWLNYKGLWGPDDNGGNSSSPGPPCKSVWSHELTSEHHTWEESLLQENYGAYWEKGFKKILSR